MVYEIGNSLKIDAENPEMHGEPKKCAACGVKFYYGGHFCVEKVNPTLYRRSVKGYFDGVDE